MYIYIYIYTYTYIGEGCTLCSLNPLLERDAFRERCRATRESREQV